MDSGKIAILATLVLGIIVVGVGCHAYFQSQWNKLMRDFSDAYEVCQDKASLLNEICPPLALEMYFVSIIIITFILSVGLLISHFLVQNDTIKKVGTVYNFVAGILIFIGAIAVIVSAVLVKNLCEGACEGRACEGVSIIVAPGVEMDLNDCQYFDEKIAAGALSLINAVTYIVAGVIGLRSPS